MQQVLLLGEHSAGRPVVVTDPLVVPVGARVVRSSQHQLSHLQELALKTTYIDMIMTVYGYR